MPANEVAIERRGQSLILKFNRPDKGNALTIDMATQLFTTLKNATTDRSVRAILLCGAGSHFMNGLDKAFYIGDATALQEQSVQLVLPYHSAVRELQAMDKPVLAAVEGTVSGPGMSMMLASDLVLSSRSAKFNFESTKHAVTPDGGVSFYLPRKVGASKALEMMMLCEDMDAAEAARIGLVNRVVEDDKLQDEALALLDKLTEGPTRAYGAIKKLVMHSFDHDVNVHLGVEHTYLGQSLRSFDFREAGKAIQAGRPPKYTGT